MAQIYILRKDPQGFSTWQVERFNFVFTASVVGSGSIIRLIGFFYFLQVVVGVTDRYVFHRQAIYCTSIRSSYIAPKLLKTLCWSF